MYKNQQSTIQLCSAHFTLYMNTPPPTVFTLPWWGGLAGLNDLTGYAGGNIVPGRASQAGQAGRDRSDKERQTGPPRMGVLRMGW